MKQESRGNPKKEEHSKQLFATGDNVEFAAVVLSVIPVLLVFIIGQKWIVKSMTHVGVKG